ncbi:MAG: GIY-YIG nuclease family protein [Gammaproteobacteria bacterium]|nr:GIY-YIG nuclease family protein [Gammaproteobacteria bacterium]
MSQWFVYILRCADGTFYTGITTDVERRLHEHNHSNKAAKYTRSRRPLKLVYLLDCENRSEAASSEHRIRHLARQQKQGLIRAYQSDRRRHKTD